MPAFLLGSKDWRDGHQRVVDAFRKEYEQRNGHTPTDRDQRRIERRVNEIAEKHHRRKDK